MRNIFYVIANVDWSYYINNFWDDKNYLSILLKPMTSQQVFVRRHYKEIRYGNSTLKGTLS